MLERAIRIAARAHEGQVDKAGVPYILHSLRVMLAVGDDEAARVVAVLHDVIEDHSEYRVDIEGAFPSSVIDALHLLTRRPGEFYAKYIERLVKSGNTLALRVKLADLNDNLARGIAEFPSLEARYVRAKERLMAIDLS